MKYTTKALIAAMTLCLSANALASSHREAPSITKTPKVDATDLYMFNSYEANRAGFVTIIANYLPLQDAYGGPNYFALDPDALYEIHIDNNGDAVEDITFQFDFTQNLNSIEIDSDNNPSTKNVAVALSNIGNAADPANVQTNESYEVTMVKGDRRSGTRQSLGSFKKPFDYIGTKSFSDYPTYAKGFINDLTIPGCDTKGRVFVGQRAEGFAIDLGRVFDLINLDPVGDRDSGTNILANKNITSIAMEVPKACLVAGTDPVIGAWTTASVRQATLVNPNPESGISTTARKGGAWTQVSRLGMPLVNEVVIGLKDKDKFNASEPKNDAANFAPYVVYPTLPKLVEILFGDKGVKAPTNFPRNDLVTAFLTGVPGINKPAIPANTDQVLAEMLRLNTTTPTVAANSQNDLGVIGGDNAGFPNGRRPGDDVTDVSLRVAMGKLCRLNISCVPTDAETGDLPYNDGVRKTADKFDSTFPYLRTPNPGATPQ